MLGRQLAEVLPTLDKPYRLLKTEPIISGKNQFELSDVLYIVKAQDLGEEWLLTVALCCNGNVAI